MYGKGLGVTNVATGISLLTPRHNHVLFAIGATLLLSGIAILAISFMLSRKQAIAK
jgi:hypothetical protein